MPPKARKSLTWKVRQSMKAKELAYLLPEHYWTAAQRRRKKKEPPITSAEAGALRWVGVPPEERSRIMRAAVLKRWRNKKKVKKTP
jgi:hypothetical protein